MDTEETGSFAPRSNIAKSPVDSLYASQPDVVLSEERDSYYSDTLLGESFSELVETFLGSRRTTLLAPEMKALSSCLYYGLTSCIGKQTLGQEYCDIALVPGSHPGRVISDEQSRFSGAISTSAAWLYSIMRVGVPYFQERMKEGWHGFSVVRRPFRRNPNSLTTGAESGLEAPAGVEPGTSTLRTSSTSATLTPIASAAAAAAAATTTTQGSRGRISSHSATLQYLGRFISWIRQKRPAIAKVLNWLLRLHLAVFYFDGRYVNLAMRAVGARLGYTRGTDPPQARYAILGLFLLVQLMGEAATAVVAAGGTSSREGTGNDSGHSAEDVDGHDAGVENLAAKRVPAAPRERTTADAALYPRSRRRCPLCMSPRENAAATPCGHLFCWECIVGWCQTNPECPLCRQPVTPQSIVCVYQYA